ncbi:MAG: hypothetical protein IKO01_04565 [Kiritimatiellae bacterium]|nr:hypothetical protein [Kiritimatiellia bacterium]
MSARHPEKEDLLRAAGFAAGCLGLAYITWKPYPMDYVDGHLLVDPRRMMVDGDGGLARLRAFCTGRFAEKRWIRFDPSAPGRAAPPAALAGMVPLWWMLAHPGGPLQGWLGVHWGNFASKFAVVFFCIAVYPAVLKGLGKVLGRGKRTGRQGRKTREASDAFRLSFRGGCGIVADARKVEHGELVLR